MKRIALFLLAFALTIPAFAQVQQGPSGQQAGRQGKGARQGRKVFKKMDKNNDRQISRDEWSRKPKAFDRLDQNQDGILTDVELKAAQKNRRNNQTPTQPGS